MSGALEQSRRVWKATALAVTVGGVVACVFFGSPARAAGPACAGPIRLTPMISAHLPDRVSMKLSAAGLRGSLPKFGWVILPIYCRPQPLLVKSCG